MRKLILVALTATLSLYAVAQTQSNVTTPKGSTVNAYIFSELSTSDRIYYDNLYSSPNRTLINGLNDGYSTSARYNCHGYAWNMVEGGPVRWIGYGATTHEDIYMTDGSYIQTCSETYPGKVSWYQDDHSAITTSTPGRWISKWGALPLIEHHKDDQPYSGGQRFFASTKITGSNSNLCTGNRNFVVQNIAGASYSWTFSSTLSAVGATNTNQVTVQRNGNSHGAAWVQVQISTACSATPVTTKVDFTAGFPQVTTPISGTNFAVQGGQYYFTQEVPLNYPAVAYNWQVSSGWQVLNNQQQQTAFIQAGSTGGFIDVSMTACGITRLNSKYVEIGGGGGDPARGTTGQDFDFTFSPNPASTTVNIIATGITTDYDVMIFDLMTSKIVKQQKVNKSQKQLTMQIGKLRSGLYVIQITSDGKSRSKQLSVSK